MSPRLPHEAGSYLGAAVYGTASFLDAGFAMATLGLSSRLGAATRTAVAESGPLFQQTFGSFSELKTYLGPAGTEMQWHHIVEQSQASQFGQRTIQSVENIVALPTDVHRAISGYYSSIQPFSGSTTVRQWLSGKPFEQQYQFGLDVMQMRLGY